MSILGGTRYSVHTYVYEMRGINNGALGIVSLRNVRTLKNIIIRLKFRVPLKFESVSIKVPYQIVELSGDNWYKTTL